MKKKILVAEDDRVILKTLEFRLKKDGFDVYLAEDGKRAAEMLSEVMPDLVLSDIMMPYVTGLELLNIVKNFKEKKIPVILLTSLGHEETVVKAFEMGVEDFLTKPFSPNELTMRIEKVLRNAQ
jgi:DNA-binding response OmpR family regulator